MPPDSARQPAFAEALGVVLALCWVLDRAAMLVIGARFYPWTGNDVPYYHYWVQLLPSNGLGATLPEYPTPVVGWLALIGAFAGDDATRFQIGFAACLALADAAFTVLLWRTARARGTLAQATRAVLFWIVFVGCVGPYMYARFDLLPAVLAGAALLVSSRRPGLAGGLVGLGAAIKLWPALLIAPPLAAAPTAMLRRRLATGFGVVGFGLAVASWLVGGWRRLISPLIWQNDRGLQIESVWATPLMVWRAVGPPLWTVELSRFNAYEIAGPGAALWQSISTLATALGLLVIAVLVARLATSRHPTAFAVALASLAIVLIMIITNKTLSPQYIVWLGGPVSAALVLSPAPGAAPSKQPPDDDQPATSRVSGATMTAVALATLLLALLTQLVFPVMYGALVTPPSGTLPAAVVLALRNAALLVFTVWVTVLAFHACGRSSRPVTPAADRGRAAPAPRCRRTKG